MYESRKKISSPICNQGSDTVTDVTAQKASCRSPQKMSPCDCNLAHFVFSICTGGGGLTWHTYPASITWWWGTRTAMKNNRKNNRFVLPRLRRFILFYTPLAGFVYYTQAPHCISILNKFPFRSLAVLVSSVCYRCTWGCNFVNDRPLGDKCRWQIFKRMQFENVCSHCWLYTTPCERIESKKYVSLLSSLKKIIIWKMATVLCRWIMTVVDSPQNFIVS